MVISTFLHCNQVLIKSESVIIPPITTFTLITVVFVLLKHSDRFILSVNSE